MADIVQNPNHTLRAIAASIPVATITSPSIQSIITEMKGALDAQDDGVAIAAPQIGQSLRIFVVAAKASSKFTEDMVFINPQFIRMGKEKKALSEGCLSVRWKYGLVKRATSAAVRAYNAKGNEFVMTGRGLLAQIFQHEMDHLDGILFIDKATDIHEMPPQH